MVRANLARYGLALPELIAGDAFELVPAGALRDVAIGVWYYDAAHSYEAQVEGLRIAEPRLVPGALVIVDDTDWDDVDRAMDDYLAEQPRARRLLTIDGKSRGAPQWWEGMQVLVWDG
jgi:predicted O-methyltransferase YrrM